MGVTFLSSTKGHSFRVMREGQAAGKGGDTGLGTSAEQGGRPRAILPAVCLPSRALDHTLGMGSAQQDPWGPH